MTTTVSVELGYAFEVKASAKDVFDVLSNVPLSASHYPKVDKLVDLGKGSYRWEMEKIGVGSYFLQTIYTSNYVPNRAKGTVEWTPVQDGGNADVSGSWVITDNKKSTKIELRVEAELSLPVPPMMKMLVQPLVTSEFETLTEKYIDNLVKRFGGEA